MEVYVIQEETNFPHMGYVQSSSLSVVSTHEKAMLKVMDIMESHKTKAWDSETKHLDTEIYHFFSESAGDTHRIIVMKVQVDK
jgi:hypothetical protein